MAGLSKVAKIAFQLDAKLSKGFGKTFDEAESRFTSVGNKLNSVGKGLTLGVTAPLLGIGVAALAVGADLESSLSSIQSSTNMTAEEVGKLSDNFRSMAVSGEYGVFSARQITAAYDNVAVAGQDAAYGTALMRSSMVLATATGNDLGQTAYFLGNYLLKVGADASDSEKYINLFAQGIANTGISLANMQNYMFRMTPAFEMMGSSAETNVGIMTRLYQVGIRGANLYSGMGGIMQDFAMRGDFATAAAERFGVSMHDANGRLRASEDIMFDVAIAMDNYKDSCYAAAFANDALTDTQFQAWFEFQRNADLIRNEVIPSLYEATSAAEGYGVAFDMAATQQSGMVGSVQQLRNSLEEIMLQISDHLLPHVTRVVDFIGVWITRFANLDEGTQRIIIGLALVAAAAGPVLMVTGKLVKGVGTLHTAYKTFKATLTAVKTATQLATAAQVAKTSAAKANTLATNADKAATIARKMAVAADTKAQKLAITAETMRTTAGVTSTQATIAATKATQARAAADALGKIASQKTAAADTARAIATKANTVALTADTAATKANALATTKLGKTYGLLLKVQAMSAASLKGQTIAMKASTIAKGALALGTKGLSAAFKIMSLAIKAIPIFGWILAGITALIAGIALLVRWLNRVGAEYQAVGEEADRLRDRQEALLEASANAVESFNHEVRVLEARAEQYEHLADCVDHATQVYNLHRRELDRLSMEYTELTLGLADTHEKIEAVEAQLSDGSNRRRRDTRALNDALDTLRETEAAYVQAMDANRRMQADLAVGIEVHADVLADLERQQYEAAAAMAAATAEMEEQVRQAERWEEAQTQALDRMNASFENYKRLTTNAFRTVNENVAISVSDMTSNLIANAAAVEEWSVNLALLTEKGLDEGLIEQLRNAGPEAAATVRELVNASDYELEALNSAFADSTRVAVESMQRELDPLGVTNSAYELIDSVAATILENEAMENALIDKVQAGFDAFSQSIDTAGFDSAGYEIPRGAAQGIEDGTGLVVAAGERMINQTLSAMEAAARINSPSEETKEMFGYMMDGGIEGMNSKYGEMMKVSEDIMDGLADTMYAKAGVVEKACKKVSMMMAKNLRIETAGFDSAGYKTGYASNVIPFPGMSPAHSAQASFSRYNYLSGDGDGVSSAPKPVDIMKRMGDAAYHQSGDVSVNYNPVYHIEGGGFNLADLKDMLNQRDSEGEAKLKQLILQVVRDEDYRMKRVAND